MQFTVLARSLTFSRKNPYNLAIETLLSGSLLANSFANSLSSGENLKNNYSA